MTNDLERDNMKTALTRQNAGEAIYQQFKQWRAENGFNRTSDMKKPDWRAAYDLFILNAPAPAPAVDVTPAGYGPDVPEDFDVDAEIVEAPKTKKAAPMTKTKDLTEIMADMEQFLNPTALKPLQAAIDALKDQAAQAKQDALTALINTTASVPVRTGDYVAKIAETKTLGQLLGGKSKLAKSLKVQIWDHPGAPSLDPTMVWPRQTANIIAASLIGQNVCLFGDRGTGKSMFIRQFAALTKRPYFEISFHEETANHDLWGSRGLSKDGSTDHWDAGSLLIAIQTPGAVVDLSEISVSRPGLVMGLNPVLERGSRSIMIDGTSHKVHPTVSIFASSNDDGSGEAAGRFVGVQQMNDSTRSRFSWVELTLPGKRELTNMISKAANLPKAAAEMLAVFEIEMQAKVTQGACESTPGNRGLIAWGELVMSGVDSDAAFAMGAEHTATSTDGAVWRGYVTTQFDHAAFTQFCTGTAPEAAPVDQAPEATGRVKNGFDEI